MIEALSTLSVSQILIYCALFAIAAKEFLTIKDFFKKRTDDKYNEENNEKKQIETILESIKNLEKSIYKLEDENQKLHKDIKDLYGYWKTKEQEFHKILQLLIESDKDAIKSFIVKEHHHHMREQWIDDFSLDTIEKRYGHYKEEGGNSYVGDLIQDLRSLPNYPISINKNKE